MTGPPGTGGTPPPPAGYIVPGMPDVAAGAKSILRARLVIVFGTGANTGMFVYSGTPALGNGPIFWTTSAVTDPFGNAIPSTAGVAGTGTFRAGNTIITPSGLFEYSPSPGAGNLIASIAAAAGTDSFSNAYFPGFCSYTALGISQMYAGTANVGIAGQGLGGANTIAPGQLSNNGGNSGATQLLSGQLTSSADVQSAINLQSANRSGLTNGRILLGATTVILGQAGNAQWSDSGPQLQLFSGIISLPAGGGPFITGETFHTVTLPSTGGFSGTIRVQKFPWNVVLLDFALKWTNTAGGTFTCGSLPDATYYPTVSTPRRYPMGTGGTPTGDAQAGFFVPSSGALSVFVNASVAGSPDFASGSFMYPTN